MTGSRLLKNPINFIKVILSNDTPSTGIMIPEKFTEMHAKDLLERVILKVPNGDVWQVGLTKTRGEIWLKNGWSEIAERYALHFGHLLMFKYQGSSIFDVIIFNATASEIVYPLPINTHQHQLGNYTRKTYFSCKLESEETCSDQKPGLKINDEGCSRNSGRKDGKIAIERAQVNFKCHKPFFMAYMYQSYVTKKAALLIPFEFRSKFWSDSKKHIKCSLQLVNDNGRRRKTWKVFIYNKLLGHGDWMMFVKDNGIRVGDVCAFQLIRKHPIVLGVTILH